MLSASAAILIGLVAFFQAEEQTSPLFQLLEASAAGRIAECQRLLKSGVNPNPREDFVLTPLSAAISNEHPEVVSLLLSFKADPNKHACGDGVPLANAISRDRLDIAKLLLKANADPNLRDENGESPLMNARSEESVRLLLGVHASLDAADARGQTALMKAANDGRTEVVRALLNAHARVDRHDLYGDTAFHLASNEQVLHVLLATGVDPNVVNGIGETRLHLAARNCDLGIFSLLLKFGADAVIKDANKRNALYYLSRCGTLGAVKLLLEYRKLPGRSLLLKESFFQAVRYNNTDVLDRLLKEAVSLESTTNMFDNSTLEDLSGITPLMAAAFWGSDKSARYLVTHGSLLEATDSRGRSALIFAAAKANKDVAALLLTAGANPNAQSADGSTALMRSIDEFRIVGQISFSSETPKGCQGRTDLVQLLLASGADSNLKDKSGQTALQWAQQLWCNRSEGFGRKRRIADFGTGPGPIIDLLRTLNK